MQPLLAETKHLIKQYHLTIVPELDQHFLIDEKIVKTINKQLSLRKNDVLLEIGTGLALTTKQLAQTVEKCMLIEIDGQLFPVIEQQMQKQNYQLIKKSAYNFFIDHLKQQKKLKVKIFNKNKAFNKIYSNLPYTATESLFTLLPKINFEIAVFIIPENFFNRMIGNIFLEAFFDMQKICQIEPQSFYPIPDAKSVLIKITKIQEIRDYVDFIIRELYLQHDKKMKNALREVLVVFIERYMQRKATKNEAREMIAMLDIPSQTLEKEIDKIDTETFRVIIDDLMEHIKKEYDLRSIEKNKINEANKLPKSMRK